MSLRIKAVALAAAVAAFGFACTPGEVTSGTPDDPVTGTPVAGRTEPGGALRVVSRLGLEDPRPIPWDRYKEVDGGIALDLFFWSGPDECYAVDHYEVVYTKKTVEVTLFEGRDPDAETCIELAVRKVFRVDFGERVGDRKVVDGSKD